MKEEFVPGLIGGGQLCGGGISSVSQSPGKRLALDSQSAESDDRSRTSCKRIKTTQVNGYIVYTRTRRTKFTKPDKKDEFAGYLEKKIFNNLQNECVLADTCHNNSTAETNINGSSCINNVFAAKDECVVAGSVTESLAVEKLKELDCEADYSSLVDVVIEGFVETLDEEISVEVLSEGSLEFDVKRVGQKDRVMFKTNCASVKNRYASLKRKKRTNKSALRVKKVENLVPEDLEVLEEPDFDGEGLDEQTSSECLANKSNLIRKRPTTVKELFETGILDGISVVYMGTVKSQSFGLRGIIKDGGILCSCPVCDWAKVISTSKFEIHACKQYRRASQYICFENGKSLLEALKICRSTPLHALEAAILDAVDGVSKEKCFSCRRCKGVISFSSLGNRGLLCLPCSEVENSQASPGTTRNLTSDLVSITSPSKSQLKITKKAIRQALVGKAYHSASSNISSQHKCKTKFKEMLTQQYVTAKALKSVTLTASTKKKISKITKKDHRLHKLVFERGGLPDGTELGYYARGQKLLGGYKKGAGIYCYCCNCEVSPSLFEAHAGWASRRKPYAYIYTSNGVSLHEWAITFSQGRKYSAKDNDDLCVICADGGNLLLCDSCPRAFHIECVSLPSIPRGNWHCKYCEQRSKSDTFAEHSVNSIAAGLLEGVDPLDQLASRCIRVVKNIEAETNGCVLCSGSDFCRSGFGPRTIIICDQCEKEYHIGCLSSQNIVDLKELPKGNWFCSMDCTRINSTLQKLLLGPAEKLQDSSLEIIQMKQENTNVDSMSDLDIRWRLINGKVTSPESRLLLSQALAIFHDCFDPIVDPVSGRNLIPRMVYGKNMQGQDYGGMCCAVLTVNEIVVSAGLLRVFGRDVAEFPLAATRMCSREKGYFQLLFSCVEKLLSFLNVESIVLPAAEEAEPLWMNKFGFRKLSPEQLEKYMKICYQMVRFKGASMLQKQVPLVEIIEKKIEKESSLEENIESKEVDESYDQVLC